MMLALPPRWRPPPLLDSPLTLPLVPLVEFIEHHPGTGVTRGSIVTGRLPVRLGLVGGNSCRPRRSWMLRTQSTASSIGAAQSRAHEIEGMVTELTAMIGTAS